MFDFVKAFKWAAAALGTTFAGTWAVVAPLVIAFKADLATGEQALVAAGSALIASIIMWVGNLIKQWREKAVGILGAGNEAAAAVLTEANVLLNKARAMLG